MIINLFIVVILLVAVGPLALIWALNTLFGLAIAYTFQTWLAALVLAVIVSGSSKASRKD